MQSYNTLTNSRTVLHSATHVKFSQLAVSSLEVAGNRFQQCCLFPCPCPWWLATILHLTHCSKCLLFKINIKLSYDWWSVGQSVLVLGHHLGPTTNFSFLLPWNYLVQVGVRYYETSSLMRGQASSLLLLFGLVSTVFLGSESRGTHDRILLSQFWNIPGLEDQVPVFISPQELGTPVISPAIGSNGCWPSLYSLSTDLIKHCF
jgi:hypothetical protein